MPLTRIVAARAATASTGRRTAIQLPRTINYAGTTRRAYSEQGPQKTSDHILVYRNYGRSFLKLFVGSLVVYSAIYYSWVGLEKGDMRRRGGGTTPETEK